MLVRESGPKHFHAVAQQCPSGKSAPTSRCMANMTVDSVCCTVAVSGLLDVFISPEPLSLLILDTFLDRSFFWDEVDVGLALGELEHSTEPRSRPCSQTKEVSLVVSLQCLREFDKKVIVLWITDVDNVGAFPLARAERELECHPFAICVQHPGDLVDQTVGLLPLEVVRSYINCPWCCNHVEFDELLILLNVEVTVDEADTKDFRDLVLFED